MRATFDHGVPFSSGMYTAVIMKSVGSDWNQTHHVQFMRQLAVDVEDLAESEAHRQNQKTCVVHTNVCTTNIIVPSTKFEIAKVASDSIVRRASSGSSDVDVKLNTEELEIY